MIVISGERNEGVCPARILPLTRSLLAVVVQSLVEEVEDREESGALLSHLDVL